MGGEIMTTNRTLSRRSLLKSTAALGVLAVAPLGASFAADYPSRPVTMIVPWGAGGGTDATGRIIAALLEKRLGQTVNVVNRTGGSGVVGHSAIATAEPDGYTIGLVTVEITMMHHVGLTELNAESYTPLGLMNADSPGVTVGADSEYDTVEKLAEAIKASEPGTFKASGTGQGGIWHLALVGWLLSLDLEPNHVTWVPSEGAAPAMQDLIAGGIDIVTVSLAETKAMVDAGRAKNLAVMAEERAASHPEVPTLKEAGGNFALATWRGICGPKDMDPAAAEAISAALAEIAKDTEFVEFMNSRGFGIRYLPPQEHAAFMAETDSLMAKSLQAAGLVKQ
jgi:tripartite-type tricarboxylate transporter receptor subunit TctC